MRVILISGLACLIAMLLFSAPAFADDPFGGPPSATSGNGLTTWGAIYVGDQCSPSIRFAAGSALWFKADTSKDYNMQVWLDDNPQWGAAFKYFENNPDPKTSDQTANLLHGFWLRVYAPDSLFPNYFFDDQAHRMDLLTTQSGIRPDTTEVNWVGMANNNKFVTDHLLWYEGHFDGWMYLQVFNKMMWDNNAVVCTHRILRPQPPAPPPPADKPSDNPTNDPLDKKFPTGGIDE